MEHTTNLAGISDWLRRSEAARVLGISAGMVDVLVRSGRLHFIPTRAGRLIDPDDLERLRRERQAKARATA